MIAINFNTYKLDRAFRRMPKALKNELGDALDYIGLKFLKVWKAECLQGPPGIKAYPHGIFTYTKRVSCVPFGDIQNMGLEIYSTSQIALLHEEGGIVTNSSGKNLAVPLSARKEMFTASGRLKQKYRSPRGLKNVFTVELKGKPFLVQRVRRSRDITPLYALKAQIRLKPRLGFFAVWKSQNDLRIQRLNRAVDQALNKDT